MLQARQGGLAAFLAGQRAHIDERLVQIRADLDTRDRQPTQARVFGASFQQIGDLESYLVGNTLLTSARHGNYLTDPFLDVELDDVAFLEIAEPFERHAAIQAGPDFFDIFLHNLERM